MALKISRIAFATSLVLMGLAAAGSVRAEDEAPAKPKVLQVTYDSPNTRTTYPNTLSLELLGRGLLYSINYDRAFGDQMAAGFGFGSANTQIPTGIAVGGQPADQTAYVVPVYFDFYFMKTAGSLFATAGVNMVLNNKKVKYRESETGDVTFRGDAIMPTFGLGYEYRSDSGFLVRATGYGIVGDELKPWFGASFGLTF